MGDLTKEGQYPIYSLTPKNETGVTKWLESHPSFDGRGTIIAIFDTGVDLGANGLQVTSENKVKIIETYDCTGAGDVNTSAKVKPFVKDGTKFLKGLTGRDLMIPSTWVNPKEEYHLGFKPLFELYPEEARKKVEDAEKEKHWKPDLAKNRAILEDLQKDLPNHKIPDKKFRELFNRDIDLRLSILEDFDKNYKDYGPMLDVVVFQNAKGDWVVCLSSDEDLSKGITLREYSKYQEFSPLTSYCSYNVSINVWDNGNLVEIVGVCGSHGTHVASISAAYFPDSPELNGVAPGAQIISLGIGDSRMDEIETGKSIARSLIRVSQFRNDDNRRIDLINMSFGEGTCFPPDSPLARLIAEVVNNFGVPFIVSGGNEGPGLSTVLAPALFSEDVLVGIGAYVSPQMAIVLHSLLKQHRKDVPYGFSSRGPGIDGSLGISLSAPGAAHASIPNYTQSGAQMMQGTSMASPNAAGCFALLICACKSNGIEWTPYSLRRAFENTAIKIDGAEPFAQGHGIIQIEPAYHLAIELSKRIDKYVRYKINCSGDRIDITMRGIYIRDPPIYKPKEFIVFVMPYLIEIENLVSNELKVSFRVHAKLTCTADWIKIPESIELTNETVNFTVLVDPSEKSPGVYYTKIDASNSEDPGMGPLFSIPVTMIIPQEVDVKSGFCHLMHLKGVLYKPGRIKRYFLNIPYGATWAILDLRNESSRRIPNSKGLQNANFVLQNICLATGFTDEDSRQFVQLNDMEEKSIQFSVIGGKVLEVVICREWEDSGDEVYLEGTLKIRGGSLDCHEIVSSFAEGHAEVNVSSLLGNEEISPRAKLTHQIVVLEAKSMDIQALSHTLRDQIHGEFIHSLNAIYEIELGFETQLSFQCPLLSRSTTYESEFFTQMVMVFDGWKKYLKTDELTQGLCGCGFILAPGRYTIKLSVCHQNIEVLHQLVGDSRDSLDKPAKQKTQKFQMMAKLSLGKKSISLPVVRNFSQVQNIDPDDNYTHTFTLPKGFNQALYIPLNRKVLNVSSLPCPSLQTVYLEGKFTFIEDLENDIGGTLIKIYSNLKPEKSKGRQSSNFDQVKSDGYSIDSGSINSDGWEMTSGMTKGDNIEELFKTLKRTSIDIILKHSNGMNVESEEREMLINLDRLLQALEKDLALLMKCTKVQDSLDASENSDDSDGSADKKIKDGSSNKDKILFAYSLKGSLLISLRGDEEQSQIDQIRTQLLELVKEDNPGVVDFMIDYAIYRKLYGRSLLLMRDKMEKGIGGDWTKIWDDKIIGVFEKLKWDHCVWRWKKNCLVLNPPDYRPF